MKAAIRMFALFVAVAGLASASLAPTNTHIRATHNSVADGDPSRASLRAPLPCQSVDAVCADGVDPLTVRRARGVPRSTKVPPPRYPFVFEP